MERVVWVFILLLLVMSITFVAVKRTWDSMIFLPFVGALAVLSYLQDRRDKSMLKEINNLELKMLGSAVKKSDGSGTDYLMRIFDMELKIEELKKESDIAYRDIVRKVLELDNKLNEKFELLGNTVVKLNKEIERLKGK